MKQENLPPWATGTAEILIHAQELLDRNTESSRRLAMIIVDNAVELMLKTFISLPKRISNIKISRKEIQESSESFPQLLDAIETHASGKLAGIDLGEIEWYHRLRNLLYHQGNGLTIEKDKVFVYSSLANELFNKLFGITLIHPEDDKAKLFAEFLQSWTILESGLYSIAFDHSLTGVPEKGVSFYVRFLANGAIIPEEEARQIKRYLAIRNKLVHEFKRNENILTRPMVDQFKKFVNTYQI